MHSTYRPHHLILSVVLACQVGALSTAAQETTAFSYSGRLFENGQPSSGLFEMEFILHSSETNDSPVGNPSTVLQTDILVTNGLFTTALDFGPDAFNGEPRWLEVFVGPSEAGKLMNLTRRVPLTPRQL